jgi:hypothetical protein
MVGTASGALADQLAFERVDRSFQTEARAKAPFLIIGTASGAMAD